MPRVRAYPGYRADVLCVLSNVLYGRAALAESVARVPGAVTLLLSQVGICTHIHTHTHTHTDFALPMVVARLDATHASGLWALS